MIAASPGGRAVVRLNGVSKTYGSVEVLHEANLAVDRGTIHALVGENGAGKSTLGHIIAGVVRPDAGEMYVSGRKAVFGGPRDALRAGIAMVTQEITLALGLSVEENVFLGIEPRSHWMVARRLMSRRYRALASDIGLEIPGRVQAGTLSVADQQRVEILRAIARGAKCIVFDEPTASLGVAQRARLFGVIERLRDDQCAIVYISHAIDDVLKIADRVTVLRNGRIVLDAATADLVAPAVIEAMLGRTLEESFPARPVLPPSSKALLEAMGLSTPGAFEEVSFAVLRGQIVGLTGLVGSGFMEVGKAIAGGLGPLAGRLELEGHEWRPTSYRHALRSGVALLPESRKEQGLLLERPLVENAELASAATEGLASLTDVREGRLALARMVSDYDIRGCAEHGIPRRLSGGNQQKLLLARVLATNPKLLVAIQPTRGVDIGAKVSIYATLVALARQGKGVLLVTNEVQEAFWLADRLLVFSRGRLVWNVDTRNTTLEEFTATLGRTLGEE